MGLGIKAALGAAAKGYVKAARVFALVLLVSSPLIMTAFAQPAGSPSLYLTTSNANVTASTGILSCTLGAVITVEGTVIMTGNYVGPVYLQGNIDVSATYTLFDAYTGTPQTVSWSWTSGFSVNGTALDSSGFFSRTSTGTNEITFSSSQCQDVTDLPVIETWKILGYSGTIDAYDNIALGTSNLIPGYGAQLLGGTSANNPTYVLAIQLPLINDPMLGATVNATDATGNPDANVAPGDGGLGPACQRESDCPSGFDCGYLVGGCSAPGVCVPEPSSQGPFDGALTPLCACNGVLLLLGSNFYGGYAPVPTEPGIQMCPDAGHDVGADGGTCGAWGQGCETSGACCSGLQCIDPNQAVPGYCVP